MMADIRRVVVADDHPLFREGVVAVLRGSGRYQVVAEAGDAEAAVALSAIHQPDLAVLDITMPGDGLAAARSIAARLPGVRIAMLTVSAEDEHVLAAMAAGAGGYVLKGVSGGELLHALDQICTGEVYVTPTLAGLLLREWSRPRPSGPLDDLTARERQVLELLAEGLSNQEIGQRLSLAEKTIKHYMTAILGKLQVRSRVEAALLARDALRAGRRSGGREPGAGGSRASESTTAPLN